jgi:hypothetical protein
MTPNQWLLFVGIPALCAIVALVADWRRTARRKRNGGTVSRRVDESGTFLHEEPPDLARSPSALQSGSLSKAEQSLEELARRGGAEKGAEKSQ